jgi:uncharacterized protein (DUF2141 family)
MNLQNSILKKTSLLCVLAIFWFASSSISKKATPANTYSITVTIKNIRNKSGRIQLHIYRNQEGYSQRKGWKSVLLYKNKMVGGTLKYTFTGIPAGVYGLALLDDENKNTVMDFGWLLPKEGYGFGDYYHTKWSTPHFNDFKFYLKANKSLLMKVRYM